MVDLMAVMMVALSDFLMAASKAGSMAVSKDVKWAESSADYLVDSKVEKRADRSVLNSVETMADQWVAYLAN